MATLQGSDESNASIQPVEQENHNFNEEEVKKIQAAIERLRQRGEPVNILVIGPTGAGKSTLINALVGGTVAKVGAGAKSVTPDIEVHKGIEHEGIDIVFYDTPGFGDIEGKEGDSIIKKMAEASKFDLILICVKLNDRAAKGIKDMFTVLGANINKEMWERTVIVLTFANAFLQLRSIRKSPKNKAEIIRSEIEDFKGHVHRFLSPTLKKETIDEIPFCIAGEEDERQLPTTDDWLEDLWDECVTRCSEDARDLLAAIARITLKEAGALGGSAAVGATAGGAIGKIIGPGTEETRYGVMIGSSLAIVIAGIVIFAKRKADSEK